MKKWILIVTLIWACFILYQGGQTLDVSLDQSDIIVDWIVEKIEYYGESRRGVQDNTKVEPVNQKNEQSNLQSDLRDQISFIIRKGAHFLEYLLLTILIVTYLRNGEYTKRELMVYPLFIVLFLSVSDEFIQSFVGRGSNVRDIVLDFSGGMVGMSLFQFLQRLKLINKN